MQTAHNGLSITASIRPGNEAKVDQLLKQYDQDPHNHPKCPFGQLSTTHYATWVAIPEQDRFGKKLPPTCMLLTSYYGPKKVHFEELVTTCKAGLREVFALCEGFPDKAKTDDQALRRFLRKHIRPNTYYSGHQYLTREDIDQEKVLKAAINDFVDQEQAAGNLDSDSPAQVRKKVQDFVKSQPNLQWAVKPYKLSFATIWAFKGLVWRFLGILALLVLSLFLFFFKKEPYTSIAWVSAGILVGGIVILLLLLLWLRIWELKPQAIAQRSPDDRIRATAATENHPVTNEMTVSGVMKKGFIHRLFLYISLRIIRLNKIGSYIPTVSSARWLQINGGQRLIFVAIYTNTSEGYARDFVDSKGRARTLNLIFGHGEGYEPTKFAFFRGGATNPKAYMNSVHANQFPTQFWYYNYADLSVDNINLNHRLRAGLWGDKNDSETRAWLRLI